MADEAAVEVEALRRLASAQFVEDFGAERVAGLTSRSRNVVEISGLIAVREVFLIVIIVDVFNCRLLAR